MQLTGTDTNEQKMNDKREETRELNDSETVQLLTRIESKLDRILNRQEPSNSHLEAVPAANALVTSDTERSKNPKLPTGMIKRGRVYYANFRFQGKPIRKRLSPDLRVAEEMLAELRHKQYRRSVGDISNDYGLKDLMEEWLRSRSQAIGQTTILRYRQNLNNVLRLVPQESVAGLNLEVIEDFRYERLQETCHGKPIKPQTVNKDVAALCTMLNWAVDRKKVGFNPIKKLSKLKEYPRDSRALEPEEVKALMECSTEFWRRVWYAYLASGTRKMELANSLFTDVDWKQRVLIVRPGYAKNSRERRIPLDDRLFEIMVKQKENAKSRQPGKWSDEKTTRRINELFTQRHIFVTTANTPLGSNVYREFKAACKRAGISLTTTDSDGRVIDVVCLHSTRHTFASNLIINGADPRSVQQLLGHRTLDMTMKIYAKLFASQQRSAISKLSIAKGMTFFND